MNQLNHQDYYVTRAATSRALALRAADPSIAAIHADLAKRYDILAAQPESEKDLVIQIIQAT